MMIFACLVSFGLGVIFGIGVVGIAIAAGRRDGRK